MSILGYLKEELNLNEAPRKRVVKRKVPIEMPSAEEQEELNRIEREKRAKEREASERYSSELKREQQENWDSLSPEEQDEIVTNYANQLIFNLENPRKKLSVSPYTDIIPDSVDLMDFPAYRKWKEVDQGRIDREQENAKKREHGVKLSPDMGAPGVFTRGDVSSMFRDD